VRDLLKLCEVTAIWVLFFGTTVYGHVALKVAVDRAGAGGARYPIRAVADLWGWSACLAWGLSCLLWAVALSRHSLTQANALSSLRYVLVYLAAWALLGEGLSWARAVGMALILAGVLLVR
jgi:drug/metabolite transporter (DMT)-like permease